MFEWVMKLEAEPDLTFAVWLVGCSFAAILAAPFYIGMSVAALRNFYDV